jgi:hypothetical protein
MNSTSTHPLMESLERLKTARREGDRVREDAIRRYNEAEARKQAVYAQIRRRRRPFFTRIREAVFG